MLLSRQLFLSTIDCSKVFSYNKVITLIQSLIFVQLFLNFEMFSFVIKIAKDVNKAVYLVNTIPMLGFINDIVEVVLATIFQ